MINLTLADMSHLNPSTKLGQEIPVKKASFYSIGQWALHFSLHLTAVIGLLWLGL